MVFLGQMLACLLTLPFAGVLADRMSRARLIVGVELVTSLLIAVQAVLVATRNAGVADLALIAAGAAVADAFARPARIGLVTHLVPASQRPQANALTRLSHYGIITLGPALGGVVVATAGAATGIGINAVSFAVSGLLMLGIPSPPAPATAPYLEELAHGWKLVTSTPWIKWYIAGGSIVVSGWTVSYGIVGATYVQTRLGGPAAWGVVASSLGAGMVAGALIALLWTPRRAGWISNLGGLPMALPGACMAADLPLSVIAAATAAAATSTSVSVVAWRSLVQEHVPQELQGRVSAWVTMGEIGLAPLSYLLVAPAIETVGLQATLAVCAGLIALGSAAPVLHPAVRAIRLGPHTAPER